MAKKHADAGDLNERLTLLTPDPTVHTLASLTRVGTTATATFAAAHGFSDGDFVRIAGATPDAYNGDVQVTVTGATTFTYAVAGAPATPATGTITAVMVSDAGGGQGSTWSEVATFWGAVMPLSTSELLQAQAVNSEQSYRVKIYTRSDVTPKMRLSWTPFRATQAKTLEIHGVMPDADEPRRFQILDVGEVI